MFYTPRSALNYLCKYQKLRIQMLEIQMHKYGNSFPFLVWSGLLQGKSMPDVASYFLERYKKPTIFHASLEMRPIYEFHLKSGWIWVLTDVKSIDILGRISIHYERWKFCYCSGRIKLTGQLVTLSSSISLVSHIFFRLTWGSGLS